MKNNDNLNKNNLICIQSLYFQKKVEHVHVLQNMGYSNNYKELFETNTKAAIRHFKFDIDQQTFSRFILYYSFSYHARFPR